MSGRRACVAELGRDRRPDRCSSACRRTFFGCIDWSSPYRRLQRDQQRELCGDEQRRDAAGAAVTTVGVLSQGLRVPYAIAWMVALGERAVLIVADVSLVEVPEGA